MDESDQALIFMDLQSQQHLEMTLKWSGVAHTNIDQGYGDKST